MHTLARAATFTLDVKKSRFTAHAAPVDTPDAALAFIREVSVANATHNCWAYRIGALYRSNDDGEPGGTAGRPMLAAIDGQSLDHVVAVVTRWYGGIKLGAGGLARAYGGAVAECLRTAPRVERVESIALTVTLPYAQVAALHALLATHAATKHAEHFTADHAELAIALPATHRVAFERALADLSRGQARIRGGA